MLRRKRRSRCSTSRETVRAIGIHMRLSKTYLTMCSCSGDHDHLYMHAVKQKEDELKAGAHK